MLALESARVGAIMPLMPMLDEELSSVRERYAPMHRLLDPDDELFLGGARISAVGEEIAAGTSQLLLRVRKTADKRNSYGSKAWRPHHGIPEELELLDATGADPYLGIFTALSAMARFETRGGQLTWLRAMSRNVSIFCLPRRDFTW
jgi:hypothetical protein